MTGRAMAPAQEWASVRPKKYAPPRARPDSPTAGAPACRLQIRPRTSRGKMEAVREGAEELLTARGCACAQHAGTAEYRGARRDDGVERVVRQAVAIDRAVEVGGHGGGGGWC